ncbi:MAG: hypothetical protein RLZZ385_57 [Pseudomonadota bacterium]
MSTLPMAFCGHSVAARVLWVGGSRAASTDRAVASAVVSLQFRV